MDFSDLVVLFAIVLIVLAILWRFVRRRGQQRDQDFSPEQQRLQDVRNTSDVFKRITVLPLVSAVAGYLSFKVPEPEASITDDEIARLNGFAEAMADAEEEAALQAQIAAEALRGGVAIIKSKGRTVRNHDLIKRDKAALYDLFGQQLGEKEARIAELEQQLEEQGREVVQLTESVQALSADSEELEQAIGGDSDGDGGAPPPPDAT